MDFVKNKIKISRTFFSLSAKALFIIYNLTFNIQHSFAQQDPQYSQYMFNHLVINPAYAGSKDAVSTTLLLRNQWVGIDGAPRTQTFSVHSPIGKKKIGVGLHVVADQIGPRKTTGIFGSYAYKLTLPKGKLAMGLRFGVQQYVYNWNEITHEDQTDGVYLQNNTNVIIPSADFGLYYYNNDMYIGASVNNLFTGNNLTTYNIAGSDNARLVPHIFVTGGKAFDITDNIIFSPSVVVRAVVNSPLNVDINANFLFDKKIWGGISYRSNRSVIALVQFNVTDKFRIGYAYDLGFNALTTLSSGSHEIMLGYDFGVIGKSRVISPRYF